MLTREVGYNRIYARINMDNLRYNITKMKSLVKPDMKVMAIIKADAYGHGSVYVAKKIADISDYYGVATIDEAIELRNAGITMPILILGYTDSEDFDKLIAYNITQTVYDAVECEKLSQLAKKKGTRARVHLKVDTGMSRIGFSVTDEGIEDAKKLKDMQGLEIEGIFTHYAKADEYDKNYTIMQKEKFLYFVAQLEKHGMSFPLKHIDNSAGTMEMDDNEFDMVRLGIVSYGLYPSDEVDKTIEIRPVMSLISHVAHVKNIQEGTFVSYGGTYEAKTPRKIATITAGYADGYPRAQSNLGRVIIRGEYAPIVGRVCMDQLMIDVTDIPDVCVKDEVILIGESDDKKITVEEVAKEANSFNYELICHIGRRVPHIYNENGVDTVCLNYLL